MTMANLLFKFLKKRNLKARIKEGEAILDEIDTLTRGPLAPSKVPQADAQNYIALMAKGVDVLNALGRLKADLATLK